MAPIIIPAVVVGDEIDGVVLRDVLGMLIRERGDRVPQGWDRRTNLVHRESEA